MVEFDFRRPSRQCSVENRALLPGEAYFSALVEQPNGELVRIDTSANAWSGPPEHCVGWWQSRVAELQKGRVYWAPAEVLLAVFRHAMEQKRNDMAWVLGTLLVRKRLLTEREGSPGKGIVRLVHTATKTEYEMAEPQLDAGQIAAIQRELEESLFTDIAANELAGQEASS